MWPSFDQRPPRKSEVGWSQKMNSRLLATTCMSSASTEASTALWEVRGGRPELSFSAASAIRVPTASKAIQSKASTTSRARSKLRDRSRGDRPLSSSSPSGA
jgi:hypothetical protein